MNILFDSSVLIAAFVESHRKHKSALSYLLKAKDIEFNLFVSAHSILEIYSVLTSAPFIPKISPVIAKKLINNNIKAIAKIIYLSDKDYLRIVDKMCDSDLKGGIVYDAIVVECALKTKIDEIITLNPKDFSRLSENTKLRIISL